MSNLPEFKRSKQYEIHGYSNTKKNMNFMSFIVYGLEFWLLNSRISDSN